MTEKNKNSAGRMYLVLATVLLGVTALAKLISAAGEARILAVRDPLLLLSGRELLIGVSSQAAIPCALQPIPAKSGAEKKLKKSVDRPWTICLNARGQ
jgi:hypothetical protein